MNYFTVILLASLGSAVGLGSPDQSCAAVPAPNSTSKLIDFLTDKCRYDKWARPPGKEDGPIKVHIRIMVYFIGSIEAQSLLLVNYRWVDPRLQHSQGVIEGAGNLRDKLWTPHLYLVNEHDSKVMGSGQSDVLVSIHPDGTVMYGTRLKATLLCLMNLKRFPFDDQQCPLNLESWMYNTSQLVLEWEDIPVTLNSDPHMTEYTLVGVRTNSSVVEYNRGNDSRIYNYQSKFSGNYSFLSVKFLLEREVGHYIMDYYVPSILLVVVSWVSFWLDPNAVPGRTTLGTSTMLTFITLSRNTGSALPKVSYIKSTEIWFIVCTLFIFGSLVEFAFVNTIWRRRKNVELKKVNSKYILKSTLTPQLSRKDLGLERCQSFTSLDESRFSNSYSPQKFNSLMTMMSTDSISKVPHALNSVSEETLNNPTPPQNKGFFTMTPQEIANWIDRRSRLVFPIAFVLFNFVYWILVWIR